LRYRYFSFAVVLVAALGLSGCGGSGGLEPGTQSKGGDTSRAERALRGFYAAANDADGRRACLGLTPTGIRQVVRVGSRAACIRTISAFRPGSFADADGKLVRVEHVEDRGDAVQVEAEVKGRSSGVYSLVERNGRLLIDGFDSEEG
jgi:hypothetical protein